MTNDHAAGDDVVDDRNSDTSYEDGGAGESLIIFAADDIGKCDGTVACNHQLAWHVTWVERSYHNHDTTIMIGILPA